MVLLPPEPCIPPGFIVHKPEGNPLSTTLPSGSVHVGCVMVPTTGTTGVAGCTLMVTLAEVTEMHVAASVTLKLYVPGKSPGIVVLVPVPGVITLSGNRVSIHVPSGGKPFNVTSPVGTEHVGCVMVPIEGAGGPAVILSI